jgi:hypothetical protein
MENVCCCGNVLTEPLASNGLVRCSVNVCLVSRYLVMNFRSVRCCGNVCLVSRWLAMDFRSGPIFRLSGVVSQYVCVGAVEISNDTRIITLLRAVLQERIRQTTGDFNNPGSILYSCPYCAIGILISHFICGLYYAILYVKIYVI